MNRKDHKGRVLKTGEGQRKDLTYQYRYQDVDGQRHTVYAATLQELREKEEEIQKRLSQRVSYAKGAITVRELVDRYIALKPAVRYNTRVGYQFVSNILQKDPFGSRVVRDIRVSDAKLWFMQMQQAGRGYSSITSIRGVVKPAFQMAYEEDVIPKNPFNFHLSDVVKNTSQKRIALTPQQQDVWMNFIRGDKTYCKYYDEFVVLLETGMRVSEFTGLTFQDLDFAERKIRVDHQLIRERTGKYYVERTKTATGCRFIPMSDAVYSSLQNIIARRPVPKTEWMVDGYTGFILLDKNENPKIALHIENEMRWASKRYGKLHPDSPLPHITPHVFRHTFCTNMVRAGMDIKSLQYLMGHSDASITMNVYAHATYDQAEESLLRILQFRDLQIAK